MANLERMGVPGLYVATVEFADAAQVQARAIGCSPPAVFVEHPIQDRTDEEMDEIARSALEEIVAKLTRSPSDSQSGTGSP